MESLKTAKDVVKFCEERGVEMIHLWFVDILGQLKAVAITLRELGVALAEGVGIDGSSVEGFARIYESDLVAMPDVSDVPAPAVEGERRERRPAHLRHSSIRTAPRTRATRAAC